MNFLFQNDIIVCDLVYIFAKRTLYRNLATNRHLTRNAVIKKIAREKSTENKSFFVFLTNYFSAFSEKRNKILFDFVVIKTYQY